jgi:two-component system NtrC family sensor kinase
VLASATLTEEIREQVDERTGLLKDNLQKAALCGRRADSIIKNMLLHSREGSGEHGHVDANALVEAGLNLAFHGACAEKPNCNATLKRDLDPMAGIKRLCGDRAQK